MLFYDTLKAMNETFNPWLGCNIAVVGEMALAIVLCVSGCPYCSHLQGEVTTPWPLPVPTVRVYWIVRSVFGFSN